MRHFEIVHKLNQLVDIKRLYKNEVAQDLEEKEHTLNERRPISKKSKYLQNWSYIIKSIYYILIIILEVLKFIMYNSGPIFISIGFHILYDQFPVWA